jgi:hypothetical protein
MVELFCSLNILIFRVPTLNHTHNMFLHNSVISKQKKKKEKKKSTDEERMMDE